MEAKILTKFTIGTEEGLNDLFFISRETAKERYTGKVADQELIDYINLNFSKEVLMTELNSLSNQYLIVYTDGEAAGYAKLSSKGIRPEIFEGKTLIRIADFGILNKYNDDLIRKSLFEKCLSASTMQKVIWISESEDSRYLDFFESYGFKREVNIKLPHELPLSPVYFFKEKP